MVMGFTKCEIESNHSEHIQEDIFWIGRTHLLYYHVTVKHIESIWKPWEKDGESTSPRASQTPPSHEKCWNISVMKPAETAGILRFSCIFMSDIFMFQDVPTCSNASLCRQSCFIMLYHQTSLVTCSTGIGQFDTLTLAIFTLTSRRWLHNRTSALAGCLFRKLWRMSGAPQTCLCPTRHSACSVRRSWDNRLLPIVRREVVVMYQ